MPDGVREILENGLAELGLDVPGERREKLSTLALALEQRGSRTNLTGHRDAPTIAHRLILDAAALLPLLSDFESLADLGSGAGFPGLPMAVLEPTRRFVLVESRERRHFFQREMIRQLGLTNVLSLRGRFDEIEPEPCEVVIAQAVARPKQLVDAMLRWAGRGALLAVPGGEGAVVQVEDARLEQARIEAYAVPLRGPARTLWSARVKSLA